jgi:peroxiredoxin (alkyl hydroperoxide reductase subunit C)
METENNFLLIGSKFPKMKVNTTHGPINLPEDKKGKWFILFSHPADFTPVCTTEFVAFQNRFDQFQELNTDLIGLSIDQLYSHIKWIEWIKENLEVDIQFPIIADHGEIGKKLGMVHPGQGTSTIRAVFIVDDKGIVRTILYYPQEIGRNFDEILRTVKALQTHEKHKVALPADWPNNELIGDDYIIPPPKSHEEAKKRLENKENYQVKDWWFVHKPKID